MKINIFTLVVRPCQRQKEEKSKKNVKIDDLLYNNKIYVLLVLLFSKFWTPNIVTTVDYIYLSMNLSIDKVFCFPQYVSTHPNNTHTTSPVPDYNINKA